MLAPSLGTTQGSSPGWRVSDARVDIAGCWHPTAPFMGAKPNVCKQPLRRVVARCCWVGQQDLGREGIPAEAEASFPVRMSGAGPLPHRRKLPQWS